MKISTALFEAFLKCPTKCWLRFTGEPMAGNTYAEWVQTQNDSYQADAARRLMANVPGNETVIAPVEKNLKTAKWRLAVNVLAQTPGTEPGGKRGNTAETSLPEINQPVASAATLETRLSAVERILPEGRGKAAQFIPIHFIFRNKLTKDDKLLLAFDAFVFAEILGRPVSLGKIIHGDDHSTFKVKTSTLVGEGRKHLVKLTALLTSPTPPDLILNRHCTECEFQARCRKIAQDKDDLSLLAGMSAKVRQKFHNKGIFTVTQLSYTFRPRRRLRRQRDKREKYHYALKALALREKKIHILGNPELKIEGTPVYLDVEGLPDRDFYYLIGVRIGNGKSAVQHSLWADTIADEGKIWRDFLALLDTVDQPMLIHYGSYETVFFKKMKERHGGLPGNSAPAKAIKAAINLVSVMFARIYFPCFSNGLKEIAGHLNFQWSEAAASGMQAIVWREKWSNCGGKSDRQNLVSYKQVFEKAFNGSKTILSGIVGHDLA